MTAYVDGVGGSSLMLKVLGVLVLLVGILAAAGAPRSFNTVVNLETTSEDSANVSMGDLDGDGDLDLVLAKGRHTPLLDRVLLNDGKGGFVASDLGPTPDRTYTAALADLDGDGDLDVLTSNDRPDKKLVYLNNGKGQFAVAGTWGVPEWSTRNAAVADLNGDRKVDVIAANRPGPSFVCLNQGSGRFAADCISIPAESATSIVPADFDEDGFIDLAVPSRDGGQSHIYFNDGKAGFARTAPFGPPDAAARVGAAADFNGDDSLDLVVGDEKAASMVVYQNDGKGRLTAGFRVADTARTPYAIAAGDLNNDGSPDIVLGYTSGPHSIFFNDGTGRQFTQVMFGDPKGAAYGFALGDINGDKFPDIALARSGAPNVLYLSAAGASSQATRPGEPPSTTYGPSPKLPPPKAGGPPGMNFATVIGWKPGETPQAPAGFGVELFAGGLDNPRWLYVLPNGDVLVAESRTEKVGGEVPPALLEGLKRAGLLGRSANRITLLRDADRDGRAEIRETFAANLNLPFGMWLRGDHLYVANTDAVVRFRYRAGDRQASGPGEKILDLPAGGYNNHWTRNIVGNADGSKIYVSVGSQTNVDEERLDAKEPRRAAILEANADGSGMRRFATGLRNPNGMDWAPFDYAQGKPGTTTLWTVVNERDLLGDDLVPDYLTSVRDGAFYGWPYSYFGQHEDPRHKGARPDLVARAVAPDYALGPHTASLGLHFYRGRAFPEAWRGAFIGQHGSWNRSSFSGYKVIHVPFRNGRPSGPPQDFLTGFIASPTTVRGRPVGVTELPDGSLLVADDAGNSVWRVRKIG